MATLDALAHDLSQLARELRQAGETELRRELLDAIKHAAEPIPGEIRANLKPHLPDRYAETLDQDLTIGVEVRTGRNDPRVTIRARPRRVKRRRLKRLDDGVLEHPLWGDRQHWYTQPVEPRFFTGPCEDSAPRVRDEIEAALDNLKDRIYRGAHL